MRAGKHPWMGPGVHGPYLHEEGYFVITVTGRPDGLGRQKFLAVWWNGEQRRGQRSDAHVIEHVALAERRGHRVILLGLPAWAPGVARP